MLVMPAEVFVLGLAIALDLALGDPPNTVHPVAWMGLLVSAVRERAVIRGRLRPLMTGLLLVTLGASAVAAVGLALECTFRKLPFPLGVAAEAIVLKSTFSIRGLARAGRAVQAALLAGHLDQARRLVGWHLVSRDTSALDDRQVAAATIESLAENASDSVIAPLVFYVAAGLPGALAYRFINTCDAMLGYHDAKREWLGKAPARLDDVANFLPARATAIAMILAGAVMGRSPRQAAAIWRRDHGGTASPNAGHPMSAAAGALQLELEKVGHYRLGRGQPLPQAEDIARAIRLLAITIGLACTGLAGCLFIIRRTCS